MQELGIEGDRNVTDSSSVSRTLYVFCCSFGRSRRFPTEPKSVSKCPSKRWIEGGIEWKGNMMNEPMPKVGDVVTVTNMEPVCRLPPGLRDGDTVKLLRFDHGYWDCEKDGKRFTIYLININSRIPAIHLPLVKESGRVRVNPA